MEEKADFFHKKVRKYALPLPYFFLSFIFYRITKNDIDNNYIT